MAPFLDALSTIGREYLVPSLQAKSLTDMKGPGLGEQLGSSATTYLNVWIYFNLIGNTILLPIVVLTFLFSKTAKRHPTLINLCITWIFSGIFALLL